MKEKCDNICETCPMQGQVYCALRFSRATNQSLVSLNERLEAIEEMLQAREQQTYINPFDERETPDAGTEECND